MSFAHDSISAFGGSTRRVMSSSALPLGTTLLLTIGSLLLPERPINGVM
jgi:hypothetical protein